MIEHYAAQYAAEGGPGVTLPTIDARLIGDCTATVMSLVFVERGRWVLADAQGQVYAEAENPAELADWLLDYTEALGRMVDGGEL